MTDEMGCSDAIDGVIVTTPIPDGRVKPGRVKELGSRRCDDRISVKSCILNFSPKPGRAILDFNSQRPVPKAPCQTSGCLDDLQDLGSENCKPRKPSSEGSKRQTSAVIPRRLGAQVVQLLVEHGFLGEACGPSVRSHSTDEVAIVVPMVTMSIRITVMVMVATTSSSSLSWPPSSPVH